MPNKIYAQEWIEFAYKNLKTAQMLYEVNHYEDIIGIELQQALEKSLKSILAFYNISIPKTHKLLEIIEYIDGLKFAHKEKILLEIATSYYKVDRYPNPNYFLPSKEEIKEVLDFAQDLFDKVCSILDIEKSEKNWNSIIFKKI
jgi:HEPN domain-containing protein